MDTPPHHNLPPPPALHKAPYQDITATPPREELLPPSFYHKKTKRKRCCFCCTCRCCCFILCIIILILILLATFSAIFYICYDPHAPQLSMQSINIPDFSVSPKPDGTYLNVHAVVHVSASNPNSKLGVLYGRTAVDVKIEGHDIGKANVPALEQKAGDTKMLKVETKGNVVLADGEAEKLLEKYEKKSLKADIGVRSGVGFVVWGLKIGPVKVDVKCGGVSLSNIANEKNKCKFTLLNWIHMN